MEKKLLPPVKFDDLAAEWARDSSVDYTELSKENSRIPNLHSKYAYILSHHSLLVKKLNSDYNQLKKIKWEYYSGDLNNPDDLKKYNLEPFNKKLLRQDIQVYLDADDELNTILLKRALHQEIVDYCERIMKEINNRTFQIGNITKWEIFIGGR